MKLIEGDITGITEGVLINGVNCQNVMGSGVAKAYYTKWPKVKESYHSHHFNGQLGFFVPVQVDEFLYVANCWTQEYYGYDGQRYADPCAILASVSQALLFARTRNLPLYTPLVGAGLGGLSKNEVIDILKTIEKSANYSITLVLYNV